MGQADRAYRGAHRIGTKRPPGAGARSTDETVSPGDRTIYFCNPFWDLPPDGNDGYSQAGAVVHEVSHWRVAGAGTEDRVCTREQCKQLATGWRPEREIGDKPKDLLTGPRGGKADDLKLIWGVGPKIEQMLNKAGIYHFTQVASWTDRELEWVDSQMGDFAGRAVRDKWIEQCKKLATGWRPSSDVGEKPH